MNPIKDARLSRKLAATATRSVALLGLGLALLVFTGGHAAWAHQDPPGCSGSGVDFKFEAYRSDSSVLDGFHPSECETITYQIKIAKSNIGTPCAFEGGTMTIKTPDGVSHNVTPGGGVPCTGGTGACTAGVTASNTVMYTVNPADVVAGLIIATGSYTAGLSHTGSTDTLNTPSVSIDLVNHVDFCAADTACRDNFCNPALYDSATGALGNCTFTNSANSNPCPDVDGNQCTFAGCNGAGTCDQNHIVTVCPADGNPCTNDLGCDSATGACVYTNTANSTPCPDSDGNQCTHAGCNGAGSCDQHHMVNVCPPDGNPCTNDLGCDSATGACIFTPVSNSTPCPDTIPNNCTAGCNGFNVCDQNHVCTVTTTTSTSTSTTSSTTTSTAPCVPTGPETAPAGHCSDMIDNDCDGLIDCSDPDCGPTLCVGGTQGGQQCATDATILACTTGGGVCQCPHIQKDPTTITFRNPPKKPVDRLKSHGRVTIIGPVNIGGSEAGWLLDNSRGRIYGVVLPPGSMTANATGTLFSYKNIAAKNVGGIYVAKIRFKAGNVNHTPSYTYSLETYGDMSAATDANMAIQFYIGNLATSAIHSEVWTRTKSGWKATGN